MACGPAKHYHISSTAGFGRLTVDAVAIAGTCGAITLSIVAMYSGVDNTRIQARIDHCGDIVT